MAAAYLAATANHWLRDRTPIDPVRGSALTIKTRSKASRALRELTEHPGDYASLLKLLERMRKDRLSHREDRGVVLMATAHVEQLLEDSIVCSLTDEFLDGNWRHRLFGGDQRGAIDGFSGKVVVAYALGLITEIVREDLQTLRRIRNVSAHSAKEIDFRNPDVVAACQFYSANRHESSDLLSDHLNKPTPRQQFSFVLLYLYASLSWSVEEYAEGPDRREDGLLPGTVTVDPDETPRGQAREEVARAIRKATRTSSRKRVAK